jgi:CheY-like chemotaxis protein
MKAKPESKATIYLADDDLDDQELLIYAFQQITDSYHLKVVSSGRELIHHLSLLDDSELPCLIVLDYNMPGLTGKDILIYLHNSNRYRNIPKVIYTTSNRFSDKSESLQFGAQDFITKAASIQGVLNSAKKMLGFCDDGRMASN